MIQLSTFASRTYADTDQVQALSSLLFDKFQLVSALDESEIRILLCAKLLYTYATPEAAIKILLKLRNLRNFGVDVVSVINGQVFSADCLYDLSSGDLTTTEIIPVESHALDLAAAVKNLVE